MVLYRFFTGSFRVFEGSLRVLQEFHLPQTLQQGSMVCQTNCLQTTGMFISQELDKQLERHRDAETVFATRQRDVSTTPRCG